MAESSQRVHLGYLDGLRGWAALFVVMHHFWQFVVSDLSLGHAPRWFSAMTVFKFGSFAVTIFIVLSGYCLMLPVARTSDARFVDGIGGFVRRRARRILPAYFATLAGSILLFALAPRLGHPANTQWDIALPALTPQSLALHAVLLHNLTQAWQWTLNPPLWSVALEWQIYFAFALVLLPVYRKHGAVTTVLVAVVLGLLPLAWGGGFASPWFLGSFALGLFAAAVNYAKGLSGSWAARVRWDIVAPVFALPVVAFVLVPRLRSAPSALVDLLLSVATAAFLIHSTKGLLEGRPSRIVRAFAHPWSAKLGEFSYSLYLVHFPLIAILYLPLRARGLGVAATFGWLVAVGVPFVLLASYAFHRLFEKPFMRKEGSQKGPSTGVTQDMLAAVDPSSSSARLSQGRS